ncbi:MAG TPA: HtaA domain-containing protein [Candidatus Corynebacterium avicola]|uniref:HtaA domain-containing protein n=1 Tax=Candidatus Corynebacterium avicola TaxID=2838527 RepID=A0A9D1RR39_9CORY|nr:HtaA domain-containing protein [Candidatus Corynebacterium avicola]
MTLKEHAVNPRKSLRPVRSLRIASASVVVATLPLVGAVALPGAVTPAVAAPAESSNSAEVSSVSQGTLSWGIKQSFRNYLTGPIAGGHWDLDGIGFTGGAKAEDGAFQFSADPAAAAVQGDDADIPLNGSMTLTGHAGLINVTLSNLEMQIRGNQAQLIADGRYLAADVDAVVSLAGGPPAFSGEPVATFNLDQTLSEAGAASGAATVSGDSWIHENLNKALLGSYGEGKNDGDRFSLDLTTAPGGAKSVDRSVQIARSAGQSEAGQQSQATEQAPAAETTTQGQTAQPATQTQATADNAQCGDVQSASVGWGIKQSFRSYLNGPIAMGGWDLNGVGFSGDPSGQGTFDFTGDPSAVKLSGQDADIPLNGSINMNGHFGALDITLSNMSVKVRGTTAQFIADYRSSTVSSFTPGAEVTGADTGSQVPIAEFTLDQPINASGSGEITLNGPGYITADGNKAFGGNYGEGNNEADPLNVTLATDGGDCGTGAGEGRGLDALTTASPATAGGATGTGGTYDAGSGNPDLGVSAPRVSGVASGGNDSETTCDASDGSTHVAEARMGWGLKESFRSYIRGSIANGGWDLDGGAVYSDGAFVFTGSDGTAEVSDGSLSSATLTFGGSVHFTGHDGVLDTTVANPELKIDGDTGTLYADVSSNDTEGNPHDYGRIAVADLAVDGAEVTDGVAEGSATATLTADGSAAMGSFYETGAEMDPLSFAAALGCDGEAGSLGDMPEDETEDDRDDEDSDNEAADGDVTIRDSEDSDGSADSEDSEDDKSALMNFITTPSSAIPSAIALIAVIVAGWLGLRLRGSRQSGLD